MIDELGLLSQDPVTFICISFVHHITLFDVIEDNNSYVNMKLCVINTNALSMRYFEGNCFVY